MGIITQVKARTLRRALARTTGVLEKKLFSDLASPQGMLI
jgi:hypothetical protein